DLVGPVAFRDQLLDAPAIEPTAAVAELIWTVAALDERDRAPIVHALAVAERSIVIVMAVAETRVDALRAVPRLTGGAHALRTVPRAAALTHALRAVP